jgi:sarcosine oxidase subunit gamma
MSNSIQAESPLHHFHGAFSKNTVPGRLFNDQTDCGLVIKEAPASTHLNLRGDSEDISFCAVVAEVLTLALPLKPGTY